ncbi:MAG: DMT family transporter [Casimicrobiaceae bacterium]
MNPSTSTARTSHRRAVLLMLLCCLLWSMAGVVTRHLDQARSFEVTFWRSFFCALALSGWFLWNEGRGAVDHIRSSGRPGLISGLCWATMFVCFMVALTLTSTANTLIVNSLSPLATALLAWLVLDSRIPRRTWLAIALAIIGMTLMFGGALEGTDSTAALGMLVALGVPLAAAVNLVTIKKSGGQVDLAPAVLIGAAVSSLATLPLALPFAASAPDIALLALLGVFQLAIPCVLLIRAARHLSAPETALLGMIEVVLGPLWTWLFAAETPSLETLIGGTVVISALLLSELPGRPIGASTARPTS